MNLRRYNAEGDMGATNTIAREIIANDLHHDAFIEVGTAGFEAYEASVQDWTLQRGEAVTGVPAEIIRVEKRADFDAAYGPPAGETPEHLIAYRKGNFEYHVGFVPDPNGRAALLVAISQPPANAPPFTIEQAMTEAHKLLPRDAQPPNPPPEANPQFVVERYTSQTLAQALPADVFAANKGQPGQFLVVYVRDPAQSTRITRFIIGPGTDPNALITQGR